MIFVSVEGEACAECQKLSLAAQEECVCVCFLQDLVLVSTDE